MPIAPRRVRSGFALVEVVVAAVVVGVLLAVFTLAGVDSRRVASLGDSINNLQQFAGASAAYTADCADRFWAFSWRAGTTPSAYPDLQFAVTDLDAAANQAVDIMRRRANPNMPRMTSWVPHILYSQLVLVDQLNLKLPLAWAVSPGDATRVAWQQWPNNPVPLPSPGDPTSLRWVYSSSFEVGPAFWAHDQRSGSTFTVEQGTTHNQFTFPTIDMPLGDRVMTDVRYPSAKAMMWDSHQRYFGNRVAYFGYPEARVPVLTVDGSVLVRATSESNNGFLPNNPTSPFWATYTYSPQTYEPPALSGVGSNVKGQYRWTRGGITGRDFGFPEVCTGQGGCTP
jgi:Tfp pilus assembly protein FimT